MIRRITLIAILISLSNSVSSAAQVEPAPKTYVDDRAGVIDGDMKTSLIGLLQELEQKTGARIIVLTVNSTDGLDIHQFAFERADTWKFGPNRESASVIMVVAIKDKKYWTEVGYDWQEVLTDGYVGEMGRKYFAPSFKEGRYADGIYNGTIAIIQQIAQSKGVQLTGMPKITDPRSGRGRSLLPCGGGILPMIIILSLLGGGRRRRGMLFWGLLAGSMMGGFRGHHGGGFGSGGFGGGGFGGFGGGGGGGFGGGGAGGGW